MHCIFFFAAAVQFNILCYMRVSKTFAPTRSPGTSYDRLKATASRKSSGNRWHAWSRQTQQTRSLRFKIVPRRIRLIVAKRGAQWAPSPKTLHTACGARWIHALADLGNMVLLPAAILTVKPAFKLVQEPFRDPSQSFLILFGFLWVNSGLSRQHLPIHPKVHLLSFISITFTHRSQISFQCFKTKCGYRHRVWFHPY
jgi:hypothetical protein